MSRFAVKCATLLVIDADDEAGAREEFVRHLNAGGFHFIVQPVPDPLRVDPMSSEQALGQ